MNTSILGDLSDQLGSLVQTGRARVVCVGTGKATPRSGLLIGNGELLTVAKTADVGESVPVHLGETKLMATVIGFDSASGIALLSHPDLEGAALTASDLPGVGSLTVTVACPIPDGHEARLGMIRCVGGETLGTGYLGIQTTAVDLPEERDGFSAGLLVTGVEADSPAERAGLQVGTFIVKAGENATPNIESLYDAMVGVRDGEEVKVSVIRSAGAIEVIAVKVALRK